MSPEDPVAFEDLFRSEWGRIVAFLTRLLGDLDRAEECAQEALVEAVERWPLAGVPENPGGWLMTTARNRALGHLRADTRARGRANRLHDHESRRLEDTTSAGDDEEEAFVESDRLRLIFTCCHPGLPRESRVALTLRMLAGLTTAEIAAAFLVRESTAAQRLVRAKKAIRDRRLPYRVPESAELPERLPSVLEVLYLVFNAGYAAHEGERLIRSDLCEDAVSLATFLAAAFHEDSEVLGLLALMELQAARASARVDEDGELVLLEDQHRDRWDRVRIERARRVLERARAVADPTGAGAYLLQAEIAACHALAVTPETTDWPRIATLYAALADETGSPVVELNRAVAVAMIDGFEVGLDRLTAIEADGRLDDYALLAATRADFLRRLGRLPEAADAYRAAIDGTTNAVERRYLERRLAECAPANAESNA